MRTKYCFKIAIILLFAGSAQAQFLGQQSLAQSSYVIDKNGNLFTWGWNEFGQLGVGDKIDRNTPQQVPVPVGAVRWTMVAGGARHALGLADSDKLYAWGSNRYGQLGTGTLGEVVIPVRVPNPPGVTAWKWISAGEDHSVALSSAGQLYAWGNNVNGQLGTGTHIMMTHPQLVLMGSGARGWAQVAAGPWYTVAVSVTGRLYAWGADSNLFTFPPAPERIAGAPYRAVSPLSVMGAGIGRQSSILGDGTYGGNDPLSAIPPQPQLASVADGANHSLAIVTNGALYSAGSNEHGQLGIGDTLSHRIPHWPVYGSIIRMPPGVTQWVQVAAGKYHSLALGNDGWLYVWGGNDHGELGMGTIPRQLIPSKFLKVGDSIQMSASMTPVVYTGVPVKTTLTVTNTSAQTVLVPSAMLVANSTITIDDAQTKTLLPSPLVPGAKDTASWFLEDVRLYSPATHYSFAYVQAPGSAPFLAPDSDNPLQLMVDQFVTLRVVDSLTGAPLPGAWCGNLVSDSNGIILFHFTGYATSGLAEIVCENHYTMLFAINTPIEGDTFGTFQMGPAPVIGLFGPASNVTASSQMFKVFYPDSLIGFALSPSMLWRTTDSGMTWKGVYANFTNTLTEMRFLNSRVGIVVGMKGEIAETFDGGDNWSEVPPLTASTLRTVWFSSRDTAYLSGDAGARLMRANNNWTLLAPYANVPTSTGLLPLNEISRLIKFNATDSGRSWVTYDGYTPPGAQNTSFAPMAEFPDSAQSLMFYGVNGHAISDALPVNYTGHANPISGIVWGHVVMDDSLTGIRGATVTRTFDMKNGYTIDAATTNELGNFVFAAIDTFHYNYKLTYKNDSGQTKTYTWYNISVKHGNILKLTFADPAPPKPVDTTQADVGQASPLALNLSIEHGEDENLRAVFTMGRSEAVELAIYDVMGRQIQLLLTGEQSAGEHTVALDMARFASGVYYARLIAPDGEKIAGFSVAK